MKILISLTSVVSDCGGDIQATSIPQMIMLPHFLNNLIMCVINISASNDQNRLNITIGNSSVLNQSLVCENICVDLSRGNRRKAKHSYKIHNCTTKLTELTTFHFIL